MATAEERFWLDANDEAIRQTLPRLNEAVGRVLTVSVAVAFGTLTWLKDDVCPAWGRAAAALLFLLGVAASAYAVLPYSTAAPAVPDELRAEHAAAVRHKRRLLTAAYALLVGGFAAAVAGAFARMSGL